MVKNILILNLTRMGDLVQSTPLVEGLREKYPGARFTLMVSSDFEEFAKRIHDIDDILALNLRQFEGEMKAGCKNWIHLYRYLESFLEHVKSMDFDYLVNLSHSKLSAYMIRYLGIRKRCGFGCNEVGERMTEHPWMEYFGTEPFNRAYNSFNLAEIFARCADVRPEGKSIRIRTLPDDRSSASEILNGAGIVEEDFLIGIQAGSSLENRRWPAGSFAELANALIKNLNAKILLFGVESERALAEQIENQIGSKDRVVNLAGKTNLSQLMALLQKCRYLVTNDTGPMHVAAAMETRIVGLFFAHAHPFETGPYGPGHLIFQARIPCAPCSYGVQCNNIVCVEKVRPGHLVSLIETHHREGEWRLPGDFPHLTEVNIYQTLLDKQNRLHLQPLLKHSVEVGDVFRLAYPGFWLDSLDGGDGERYPASDIADTLLRDYDCENMEKVFEDVSLKIDALRNLSGLGKKGIHAAGKIIHIVMNKRPANGGLRELGEMIETIDREINLIGCTHPEVKPISDMFVKRKENFQGEDPLRLARATANNYRTLRDESGKMAEWLADLKAACLSDVQSMHSSINVAVPGR